MITVSDAVAQVLTRSHRRRIMVESWLGSELLSASVPVDTASEETDRRSNVPERVTFTVPRRYRGELWSPVTDDHPLAANGQRLRVQLGIDVGNGVTEWFQRGWFLISNSEADGDVVNVEAAGLLWLIQEARFVSPFNPSGTLYSTLRALVEPALTVVFDTNLSDRSVPAAVNWDEDRLAAVQEVTDSLGADYRVTEDGYLSVFPSDPSTTPVLELTDGTGGTIITASGSSSRDGAANAFVARGTASDGAQIQAVQYEFAGAKAYGGNFNPLPVPDIFYSPLLTTQAQCAAAALTRRERARRNTGREFRVEMVPNPTLQAGDTVSITAEEYTALPCTIEALTLPYTAAGGSQTLTVRSLS